MSKSTTALLSARNAWRETNLGNPAGVRVSNRDYFNLCTELTLDGNSIPTNLKQAFGMTIVLEPDLGLHEFVFLTRLPETLLSGNGSNLADNDAVKRLREGDQ